MSKIYANEDNVTSANSVWFVLHGIDKYRVNHSSDSWHLKIKFELLTENSYNLLTFGIWKKAE